IYYQNQQKNDIYNYWPLYSDPANGRFVNADPSRRATPDKFYLTSLRIQGDLGPAQLISNTSYYHRREQTGYEGTLYNLGFYQTFMGDCPVGGTGCLLDNTGVHLPAGPTDSYFLKTNAKDEQYALFGELSYGLTDRLKGTLGARFSRTKYSFDTLTGGPQLFASTAPGTGSNQENAFTPRVGLQFQMDPN